MAISPASRTFTIIFLLVPAIFAIYVFLSPVYDENASSDPVSLTINFSTEACATARQTETKVTSVIENWLTLIPGIKDVYSETMTRNGLIRIFTENHKAPEEVLASIKRLTRLRKNQLPDDIQISYNFADPRSRTAEIFLTGKYPENTAEVEKLEDYLSALDGIRSIQVDRQEDPKLFHVTENFRGALDSASLNRIPGQMMPFLKGKTPVAEVNATELNNGSARIPLPSALQSFTPVSRQFLRYNGMKVIRMTVTLENTDPWKLFLYLRNWKHFSHDIILPSRKPPLRGFQAGWIIRNELLLLFLAIISMLLKAENQFEHILAGIVLIGLALYLPVLFEIPLSDAVEHLSEISLAASLILLYSLRFPKRGIFRHSAAVLIFVTGAVLMLNDQWIILITPFIAFLLAYGLNPPIRIREVSLRILYPILIILPVCLSQFLSWKLWGVEAEGIWIKMERLPEYRPPEDHDGRYSMTAHLFLKDRDPLFSSSYIFQLEKELIPLLKYGDHLFIEMKDGNSATLSIDMANNPKPAHSLLVRQALMCSGINWYISHGESSFSNVTSPLLPSIQWVLSGYNLDSLDVYTEYVADLLRSTARVKQVSIQRASWMPYGISLSDIESWRADLPASGALWPQNLFAGDHMTIMNRPPSRWRLYHERYFHHGRFYRGYQLLDSLEQLNEEVIRKKNRGYLTFIGHEFSGGKKLTDKFMLSAQNRINAALPPGISLLDRQDDKETRFHGKKKTVSYALLSLLCISLIRAGNISGLYEVFAVFSAVILSLWIMLNIYMHVLAENIPEWPEHLLILAFCLIAVRKGRFHSAYLFPGIGFTILMAITGKDWSFTGGMATLLIGLTIVHLAWRPSSVRPLLLRIWHGHRSSQKH